MEMNDFVGLMLNNGIGVVCIAYFMFRDYKFMQKLTDLLSSLQATLDIVRKYEIDKHEEHEDGTT